MVKTKPLRSQQSEQSAEHRYTHIPSPLRSNPQSFSMGCQNVLTKGLASPMTIPTQVATGAMSELFSDPKIFAPFRKNWPRNERIIFLAVFFAGGVIGGLAYRYSSPPLCLLLTAIFKLLAAGTILFM